MTKVHDKKSIPWRDDPDILRRLAMVATLMQQGAKNQDIADSMSVSLRTANRDIARVRELWRKQSELTIEDKRAASVARYEDIITRLYKQFRKLEGDGKDTTKVLLAIAKVESEKAKVEGTLIQTIDLTSKGEQLKDPRGMSDSELFAQLAELQSKAQRQG